jgi:hypothetical protein
VLDDDEFKDYPISSAVMMCEWASVSVHQLHGAPLLTGRNFWLFLVWFCPWSPFMYTPGRQNQTNLSDSGREEASSPKCSPLTHSFAQHTHTRSHWNDCWFARRIFFSMIIFAARKTLWGMNQIEGEKKMRSAKSIPDRRGRDTTTI